MEEVIGNLHLIFFDIAGVIMNELVSRFGKDVKATKVKGRLNGSGPIRAVWGLKKHSLGEERVVFLGVGPQVDLPESCIGKDITVTIDADGHAEMGVVLLDSISEDKVTIDSWRRKVVHEGSYGGGWVVMTGLLNDEELISTSRGSSRERVSRRLWRLIVWHELRSKRLMGEGVGGGAVHLVGQVTLPGVGTSRTRGEHCGGDITVGLDGWMDG